MLICAFTGPKQTSILKQNSTVEMRNCSSHHIPTLHIVPLKQQQQEQNHSELNKRNILSIVLMDFSINTYDNKDNNYNKIAEKFHLN